MSISDSNTGSSTSSLLFGSNYFLSYLTGSLCLSVNLPVEYEKSHCAKHLVCKKRTWPMFPEYRSHASSITNQCCSPYGRIFYKFNITLSLTLIKPCTIWGQIGTHLEHDIQMFHISQLFYPIFFFWKVILAQLDFKEKLDNILKHKRLHRQWLLENQQAPNSLHV